MDKTFASKTGPTDVAKRFWQKKALPFCKMLTRNFVFGLAVRLIKRQERQTPVLVLYCDSVNLKRWYCFCIPSIQLSSWTQKNTRFT